MENHKSSPAETPKKADTPARKKIKTILLSAAKKSSITKRVLANKWARLAAILVVAVPLVSALTWWGWSHSSLSKLSVNAALVEGSVEYRIGYDYPWEKAQEGMSFAEGAHLRTAADSRAVLNIDDGSSVRLNGDSSVVLTKLTARHIVIENTGGDIYTRVAKSRSRKFEVITGRATYRSEGTAYRTFNTDVKKGVEVYHSKVNILGVKDDGNIAVTQGKRYYLVNAVAADTVGKVTELSLEELSADEFIRWNSEQDKKHFEDELGVLSDLQPPSLEITAPTNGFSTEAATIDVTGTTEADARVLVNGTEAANDDGQFTARIGLNEGANSIKVEATDTAGNSVIKDISVTRTATASQTTASFILHGTKVDKGISFTWSISGIPITKGFKLVKGTGANPTYSGKSNSVSIESSSARSYTWKIQDGKTYHFRICVYAGDGCSQYSNDVTVTAPPKPASTPPTGSLTLNPAGGNGFTWSISGGTALYGYKLVWSSHSNPTYPDDSAKSYEKTAVSGSIDETSGNYKVRLCMYYDGSCINYSNELSISLP